MDLSADVEEATRTYVPHGRSLIATDKLSADSSFCTEQG